MREAFRVIDIVNDPSLDTHAVAGREGLDRPVMWAHSCELPDAETWLGPHELLMTIGLGVPVGSSAQREFIRKLDEAGLSGVSIGIDGLAPRLTKALLAEADARAFPVLRTGPSTPFAALGRTVSAANADRQTMVVLLLAKLYQISGTHDEHARRSGARLSELFRTSLTVIDDATGCVLIGENPHAAPSPNARTHSLRTHRPTHLHVDPSAEMDGFALVHLLQVLTVDTNAILQNLLVRIERAAAALQSALNLAPDALLAHLDGTGADGYRLAVLSGRDREKTAMALAVHSAPGAVAKFKDATVAVVPSSHLEQVRDIFARTELTAGVSSVQKDFESLAGAFEEAGSEYSIAAAHGERWREYRGERISLLSRSHAESLEIVRVVLGVLAQSNPRSEGLRSTLFALLEEDLNWGRAAQRLGIHRQTLVYRMNNVEQLTGRSVRRMTDLGELWLAHLAWKQVQGFDPGR